MIDLLKRLTLALILSLIPSAAANSEEAPVQDQILQMQKMVNDLQTRVEKLEHENQELRDQVNQPQIVQIVEPSPERMEETKKSIKEEIKDEILAIGTKYDTDLYGELRLDAAYDTGMINEGNFARWVEPEVLIDDDEQFNMTARQSRLGLNFKGPSDDWLETSGKLEIDFFEGGNENKNRPMMRHAYLELKWPQCDFSILAGQTWDVIAPLNPSMLNYSVAWWSGNIGYRRPQLRLTKGYGCGPFGRLEFQVAALRDIGHTAFFTESTDSGEDSGKPALQGRIAYSRPLPWTGKEASIGLSGQWADRQLPNELHDDHYEFTSTVGALDLTLPITSLITLKAEAFKGKSIDCLLGGIGQGINLDTQEEIHSKGSWAAVSFGPVRKYTLNLGAGIDDPDDEDLSDGGRTRNTSVWGNVLYDLNEAVQIGLEVSRWDTEYKNLEDGDAWRFQTSFIYRF
jgi:hypothetical protein